MLKTIKKIPSSSSRIICAYHAGGNFSFYRHWFENFNSIVPIEICVLQRPGREDRFDEPPFTTIEQITEEVLAQSHVFSEKPFIFFGHSLGAFVVYEITRALQKQSLPLPQKLIVSGCRAPHVPLQRQPIYDLHLTEFKEKLQQYNAIPQEIIEFGEEAWEIFLPITKADFQISETYQPRIAEPLNCSIVALHGAGDTLVAPREVKSWQQHTTKNFEYHEMPGDHFFIKAQQANVFNILNKHLCSKLISEVNSH